MYILFTPSFSSPIFHLTSVNFQSHPAQKSSHLLHSGLIILLDLPDRTWKSSFSNFKNLYTFVTRIEYGPKKFLKINSIFL